MPNDENQEGAAGFLDQSTTSSEYNALFFKVMGILAGNNFNVPVKIIAVSSAGELAMAGRVDVQPMINQITGDGVAIPHGVIHGIPYFRMQGGTDAIILDPKVGDYGIMMCADKDISSLKANRSVSNPGSARVHDLSDGIYFGGLLNGVPTQFMRFYNGGIEIRSPDRITQNTMDWTTNAPFVQFNGNVGVSENLTVGNGASGAFTTVEGLTVTVQDGIVTNIF